ncbi:MAG: hypothetical protein JO316_25275 [Abitibacteriaceae bacterium]|nr:hypothetical protein [Abditibacteriaceae bacterium]
MFRDKLLFYCYLASFVINCIVVAVLGYSRIMSPAAAALANPEAELHPVRLGVYKPPPQPVVKPTPPKPTLAQHGAKSKNRLAAHPQQTAPQPTTANTDRKASSETDAEKVQRLTAQAVASGQAGHKGTAPSGRSHNSQSGAGRQSSGGAAGSRGETETAAGHGGTGERSASAGGAGRGSSTSGSGSHRGGAGHKTGTGHKSGLRLAKNLSGRTGSAAESAAGGQSSGAASSQSSAGHGGSEHSTTSASQNGAGAMSGAKAGQVASALRGHAAHRTPVTGQKLALRKTAPKNNSGVPSLQDNDKASGMKTVAQLASKAADAKGKTVRLAANDPDDKSKDEPGAEDEPGVKSPEDKSNDKNSPEAAKKEAPKPQTSNYIMPKVAKMWTVRPNQKLVLPKDLKLNMPANLPIVPGVKPLTPEQIEELRKLLHQQNLKQMKGLSREQLKKFLQARKDTERPKPTDLSKAGSTDSEKKDQKQPARPKPRRPRVAREHPEGGAALPAGLTSPFKYKPWSPAWQRYAQVVKKAKEDRVLLAQNASPLPASPEHNAQPNSTQNNQAQPNPAQANQPPNAQAGNPQPNTNQTGNAQSTSAQATAPANQPGGNTQEAQNDQHAPLLGTGQGGQPANDLPNGVPVQPGPPQTGGANNGTGAATGNVAPDAQGNTATGGQGANSGVGQPNNGQPSNAGATGAGGQSSNPAGNNQQNNQPGNVLGGGDNTGQANGAANTPAGGHSGVNAPSVNPANNGQAGGNSAGNSANATTPNNGQPTGNPQNSNQQNGLLGSGQANPATGGQPINPGVAATNAQSGNGQSNNGQANNGQPTGQGQTNNQGALLGAGQGNGQPNTAPQNGGQAGTGGTPGNPNAPGQGNQGGQPNAGQGNNQGGLLGGGQGSQPAGQNNQSGPTGNGGNPGGLLGAGQGSPQANGQPGGQPDTGQRGNQGAAQGNGQGGLLGAGQATPPQGNGQPGNNQPGGRQGGQQGAGLLGAGQGNAPAGNQQGNGQQGGQVGLLGGGQGGPQDNQQNNGQQTSGLLGGGQGNTAANNGGNGPQQGGQQGGLLGGGQQGNGGNQPAGPNGGGLLGGDQQGGQQNGNQNGQQGTAAGGGGGADVNAFMAQGDGGLEGGGFVDSEGVGGEGDVSGDGEAGGDGNQADTGFTPAVGVSPNMPEHNHDAQKGIPGALVLPPLPPVGTETGKELDPHEVKPSSHTAKIIIPALMPPLPTAKPTAHTTKSVPPKTEPVEPGAKAVTIAKPRRLAMAPGGKPKPRQSDVPVVALNIGSTSDQGTIPMDIMKQPSVPLGTATDAVNPPSPSEQSRNVRSSGVAHPQPRGGAPTVEKKGTSGKKNGASGKQAETSEKPVRTRQTAEQRAVAMLVDENQIVTQRVIVKKTKQKPVRNSRGIKEGSKNPLPPMPLPDSDAEIGDGSGLKGEYFLGRNFEQYEFTRADPNLDLFWGSDSSPSPRLPAGADWSCRWTGKIEPRYSETYTIYAVADDGVRVWINHKLIIDDWTLHALMEYSGQVKLEAGKQYDIRVDYFESGGPPASVGVYWESPSQKKEFIPEDRLFYPLAGDKEEMEKDEVPHH